MTLALYLAALASLIGTFALLLMGSSPQNAAFGCVLAFAFFAFGVADSQDEERRRG